MKKSKSQTAIDVGEAYITGYQYGRESMLSHVRTRFPYYPAKAANQIRDMFDDLNRDLQAVADGLVVDDFVNIGMKFPEAKKAADRRISDIKKLQAIKDPLYRWRQPPKRSRKKVKARKRK